MPVRIVIDENPLDEFNDESSNRVDYSHFIGRKVYAGRNSHTGITTYKSPSTDAETHAELSHTDLVKANHFLGKGEEIETTHEGAWLKLAYQKPVWVLLDSQDLEAE